MADIHTFWRDLELIRASNPLVLNVTNYVVANSTANALLAIGASPIMSFSAKEAAELVELSNGLVINTGTLNTHDIEVMTTAWDAANQRDIPVVLDPVGAGASRLRIDTPMNFLSRFKTTVIRGNASEIMSLAGEAGEAKGVDSTRSTQSAFIGAKALALVQGAVVCISGEHDMVTDGVAMLTVHGGDPLMPRVTGLGCTASALCGAFAAVNGNALEATAHAMAAMAIGGAMAGEKADGPGTLQLHLFDALHSMDKGDVERLFHVEATEPAA